MKKNDLPTTFVLTENFGPQKAGTTFSVEWAENRGMQLDARAGELKWFYATKFMHQLLGVIKFGILADKDTGAFRFIDDRGLEIKAWAKKIKPLPKIAVDDFVLWDETPMLVLQVNEDSYTLADVDCHEWDVPLAEITVKLDDDDERINHPSLNEDEDELEPDYYKAWKESQLLEN